MMCIKMFKQCIEMSLSDDIDTSGWFIKDKYLRIGNKCFCDEDSLLLPPREITKWFVFILWHTDMFEGSIYRLISAIKTFFKCRFWIRCELHYFLNRHGDNRIDIIGFLRDILDSVGTSSSVFSISSYPVNTTACWREKPKNHLDKRCFSFSIFSKHRDKIPLFYGSMHFGKKFLLFSVSKRYIF